METYFIINKSNKYFISTLVHAFLSSTQEAFISTDTKKVTLSHHSSFSHQSLSFHLSFILNTVQTFSNT